MKQMLLRLTDQIWHVRGSLTLPPAQSSEDAFDKIAPLFHEPGTNYERGSDTLTFTKKDQAAQDKMSVFDSGMLHISRNTGKPVLHYNLASRALLYCFLAPLLFLAFAQGAVSLGKYEKAKAEASEKTKKPEKEKDPVRELHPIDKALGAPAPEKKKDKDKGDDYSPKPAYVFAGLFAVLYVVGRILEDRLVRAVFRKSLFGPNSDQRPSRWALFQQRWQRRDRSRMISSRMDLSGISERTVRKP